MARSSSATIASRSVTSRRAAWLCVAARRLVTEREEIVAELERAKQDYLGATKGSSF